MNVMFFCGNVEQVGQDGVRVVALGRDPYFAGSFLMVSMNSGGAA
jgi:hypothetical protein